MALPGKLAVRKLIKDTGGCISDMAREAKNGLIKKGVSRQTIYNWIDHYGLRAELEEARVTMRLVSRDVIYDRLMNEDSDKAFEAAKFVTLHLNDAGELLAASPEVMALLKQMGIPMSDVARAFEDMVRLKALEDATRDV